MLNMINLTSNLLVINIYNSAIDILSTKDPNYSIRIAINFIHGKMNSEALEMSSTGKGFKNGNNGGLMYMFERLKSVCDTFGIIPLAFHMTLLIINWI